MNKPLADFSDGRMRVWPGGLLIRTDRTFVPCFRPWLPGERPVATVLAGADDLAYCKYCYGDRLTFILREEAIPGRITEMLICAECGCGLTPPKEVLDR